MTEATLVYNVNLEADRPATIKMQNQIDLKFLEEEQQTTIEEEKVKESFS